MALIGLVGFAGSGKDTVANILNDVHKYEKTAFADPLKDAVSIIFDWPRYLLEGDSESSRTFREKPDPYWSEKFGKDFTPRMALQRLGTEACRQTFHQDIWILNLEKRISNQNNVVVTDVRFPNEIEFIKKMGGHVVRVKRGDEPEWWNYAKHDNDGNTYDGSTLMTVHFPNIHVSEWAWIGHQDIQYTIFNVGSMDDLRTNVRNFLHSIETFDTLLSA
jgi:hypothetical protein